MTYIIKILIQCQSFFIALYSLLGAFFLPIQPLIVVATIMALFDWVVKIYCILTTQGKEGIESGKMQKTFGKILVYAGFISVMYIIDTFFIKPFCIDLFSLVLPDTVVAILTKGSLAVFATLMILAREFKSLDENLEQAFNFSPVNMITDNFSWLLKWKK